SSCVFFAAASNCDSSPFTCVTDAYETADCAPPAGTLLPCTEYCTLPGAGAAIGAPVSPAWPEATGAHVEIDRATATTIVIVVTVRFIFEEGGLAAVPHTTSAPRLLIRRVPRSPRSPSCT